MKKVMYFILIVLIMTSCEALHYVSTVVVGGAVGNIDRACHKSINKLEKDTIPFDSLPAEIKDFFYNVKNMPSTEIRELTKTRLFTFNTNCEYELIRGKSITAPYLLIDKTNNLTYRYEDGSPFPIIVFDREIFIPTKYWISKEWKYDFEKLEFTRCSLDSYSRRSKQIANEKAKSGD